MADVKKIATRDSYGNALKELGDEFDDVVVLDADLAGATKTGIFKKAHPDRFFDCGIQEANMVRPKARQRVQQHELNTVSEQCIKYIHRFLSQMLNCIPVPVIPIHAFNSGERKVGIYVLQT